MKTSFKKYLAIILSACMVFTLVPTATAANAYAVTMTKDPDRQIQYGIELNTDSINEEGVVDVTIHLEGTPYKGAEEPADVILMIDKSGSMVNDIGAMKAAAKNFVKKMDYSVHRVGLVIYDNAVTDDCKLAPTTDKNALLEMIDAIPEQITGGTAIYEGIKVAVELLQSKRTNASASIVLMTDGVSSYNLDLAEATNAKALGYSFYTVALCKDENSQANLNLKKMATSEADHYSVFSSSKLDSVYSNIASKIGNVNAKNVIITQDTNYWFEIVPGSYSNNIPVPTVNGNSMSWEMTQLVQGDATLSYQIRPRSDITDGDYYHSLGAIYYTDYKGERVKLDLPKLNINVSLNGPQITSVTPDMVDFKGGEEVTLTGKYFKPNSYLTVDGVNVPCTYVSDTELKFIMPAHDVKDKVPIVVKNPNGKTARAYIKVKADGLITSITPNTADENKKQKVTITGEGFKGTNKTCKVYVNGKKASLFGYPTNTQIICQIPALPAGTYDVVVENSDGTTATLAQGFTVIGEPPVPPVVSTITSISPNTCEEDVTQKITITGTNFNGTNKTCEVYIGTTKASMFSVADTQIVCKVPKLSAGTYDVKVINADDTEAFMASGYTVTAKVVDPCTITSISPNTCEENTAQKITIKGTMFNGTNKTCEVYIGTEKATMFSVSETEIVCKVPAMSAGTYDVKVINADDTTATLASAYTVTAKVIEPCTITSVSPNTCEQDTAQKITITGTKFNGTNKTCEVYIGTELATMFSVSETEIVCRVPAMSAGTYDVKVVNADGTTATLASAYTVTAKVVPVCQITGLSTTVIDANKATNLWIYGKEFNGSNKTCKVYVGTKKCSIFYVYDYEIKVRVPALAAGTYDITVENADGTTATSSITVI